MSSISFFDNVDFGGYGRGAQCFDGICSQDRVDVPASATFPATPHAAVGDQTRYAAVYLTAPALIYAGKSPVVPARAAAYPAGWWPMAVEPGHVISIKDL